MMCVCARSFCSVAAVFRIVQVIKCKVYRTSFMAHYVSFFPFFNRQETKCVAHFCVATLNDQLIFFQFKFVRESISNGQNSKKQETSEKKHIAIRLYQPHRLFCVKKERLCKRNWENKKIQAENHTFQRIGIRQ